MTDLDGLHNHLTEHFRLYGPMFTDPAGLANLAISGIGTLYPNGWEIIPDVGQKADGVTRMELIREAANGGEEPQPGREVTVRYRGVDVDLTEGIGDVFANLHTDEAFYCTLPLASIDDGHAVAEWIRNIDLIIDVIREDES